MPLSNRSKLIVLDADVKTLRAVADAVSAHYETIRVRDAEVALALCEEDPQIRVIVAEHTMHGPTGQSVLDLVRARHPHVRRVMLTTYNDLSVIVNGLHTGAIQHLVYKPIRRAELLAAVGQSTIAPILHAPAANLARCSV